MTLSDVQPIRLCAALTTLASLGCAPSYVTKVGGGTGYAIDFVTAAPSPGTVLTVGDTVAFAVTVRYVLEVRERGHIFLVFENHSNRLLFPGQRQAGIAVAAASGTVTVADTIVVPGTTTAIHLFVPLVPDGFDRTSGELLLTYPVKRQPN
jgi:hypothetical protein